MPLADGGAWVRRGDELIRVAPDLSVATRGSVALASAFHWDPQTRRLWVAAGSELLRYDADLRLEGVWRFDSEIRGVAGSGPEAVWAATERVFVRVGSDGATRESIEIAATTAGSPVLGVLADHARAVVWIVRADGEALAIDVSGPLRVQRRLVLPADSRAVYLDPAAGRIVINGDSGWRFAGSAVADAAGPIAASPSHSLGVLRISADPGAEPSIAIAAPVVTTKTDRDLRVHLLPREPVTLAFERVDVQSTPAGMGLAIEPAARCGPIACVGADPLIATLEAEAVIADRTLRGMAERRGDRWVIDVEGAPLAGPAVYSLDVTLVDGFGNRSDVEAFEVDVDSDGWMSLRRITPKATPAVSITSPANNAVFVAPASVTVTASASVTGATLTKVEFYRNGTLLATDTSAPYSYAWTNVAAGTYALTAKAYDNAGGTTTSTAVNITVRANVAPTVSMSAPLNNAVFAAPATINLAATASDSDGTIAKVEFFRSTTRIAAVTTAPFQYSWTNVAGGTYALTAKATDDKGAVTTSAVVNIVVNRLPVTAITAPANNAVLVAPVNVTVTASASDPDGTIAKVEFFLGATRVATDTAAPYSYGWNNVPLGTHTFTSKAFDNRGATTTSAPVTFTVNANVGPSVAITSPASGAQFVLPASIPVAAAASDPDGSIARVEFYYDYGLIGSDSSNPYGFTWTLGFSGTFTLTAKAFDNKGASITSAPVSITMNWNQPPAVTLVGDPPAGTLVAAVPPPFRLTATAADPDGTVANVRFLLVDYSLNPEGDITLLGTVTQAPYTLVYTPAVLTSGYRFRAEATDNGGAVGSAEISYTVVANAAPQVTTLEPGSADPVVFMAPATVVVVADAKELTPSDRIVRVEFLANGSVLGSVTSPNATAGEFVHVWRDVPIGDHQIRVRAFDTFGAMGEGYPRNLRVLAPGGAASIAITQPVTGQVYGASVPLQVSLVPGSSAITNVDYVNAIGSKVGTSSVAPYTASWTAPAAGRHALTAVAVDVNGMAMTSATVFFDVESASFKQAPIVVLTSPLALSTINADSPVAVAAETFVQGATITKVEFFNRSTLIGTATNPPYRISWSNPAPLGTATLTAKATDSTAPETLSSATSSPITVTLTSTNPRPAVWLTAPNSGAQFAAPASINLAATATDAGGSITKVEFFAGSTLIGTDTTAPYTLAWTGVAAGTYTLTAKATDNGGASTTSSAVVVTVINNAAPQITLNAPANGASFAFGAPITLTATATDAESAFPKVEFFDGTTLLATLTATPYTYTLTNGSVGTHSITARATDGQGATATTAPAVVSITANSVPSVVLVLPRPNQRFVTGATIRFVATAADADGSVARVEFVRNGTILGTSTAAPHEFQWTNVPTGSYSVSARAADNRGAVITSTAANITVSPLSLTIATPLDNATVNADFVFVSGTLSAPPNSGLTVNGVRAQVYGNQFFANHVPLIEGSNVISATLATADELQALSVTRTVNRTSNAPVRIHLDPDSGFAPMTTTIRVENRSGLTIAGVSFENLGSAVWNSTGAGQEMLGTLSMGTAAIYKPTVVITDSAGNVYRQTIGVLAASRPAVEQTLKDIWNGYTALLAAGRVDLALATLPEVTAARYRRVLEPLAAQFAQIIPTWSAPSAGLLAGDIGEFTITRVIEGQKRLFFVYFVRDDRGTWRLDSM